MRIIGAFIGWLLIIAGLAVAGREVIDLVDTGAYHLIPLGQVWFELHAPSQPLVQTVIERYIWPPLWDFGLAPLLHLPAALTSGLLGLGLLLFCRRRGKRRHRKMT